MHSLHSQLNLSEAKSQKRFKGCYLLESVKVKTTDAGWPVRIATIKDVQNHNSLELRLLGSNFLAINHFIGDYIQLEAAVKRYRNGQFFYLAWYEPVTGFLMDPVKKGKNVVQQINREACFQALRLRIMLLPEKHEQDFCLNILHDFNSHFSNAALKILNTSDKNLDNDLLIVELVKQARIQSEDISAVGELLYDLPNKQPYVTWEQKLLGS